MAGDWLQVCRSQALTDGGAGVRFSIGPERRSAFVLRARGRAVAWFNRCGHVPVELDWPDGMFFDEQQRFIRCATHGAIYDPITGACRGGPCAGRGLRALDCVERDGVVWVRQHPASNDSDSVNRPGDGGLDLVRKK